MGYSILYAIEKKSVNSVAPSYFSNLNLDQIVSAILSSERDKDVYPYYCTPLVDKKDILYRQETFRDFENKELYLAIQKFFARIQTLYSLYQKYRNEANSKWLARRSMNRIVDEYLRVSKEVVASLKELKPKSECLVKLTTYLDEFTKGSDFIAMQKDLDELKSKFEGLTYTMVVKGSDFYISEPNSEDINFGTSVNQILDQFHFDMEREFEKAPETLKDSRFVDEAILSGLAAIYKKEFQALDAFATKYKSFFSLELYQLSLDFRFYSAYMTFMQKIKKRELSFTIPEIIDSYDEESIDSFDLALAYKLMSEDKRIVTNSYTLTGSERMMILSGPNQGGKTTFSRQLGQLHYLASLGVPVMGTYARLHKIDAIYAYYKTEENLDNLNGKLESELEGVKEIMDLSTKDSLLLFNEIFASTTALDGIMLGKKLIDLIKEKGCIALFVTFYDELSKYNEITTSLVSNVSPDNPMIRTFKITKRPSDGMAYANAISERHHMTYQDIRRRIR